MKRFDFRHGKILFLVLFMLLPVYTVSLGAIFDILPPNVSAASSTVVGVDPSTNTAEPGQYFTINLNVTSVEDLYSWGTRMSWSSGLLEVPYYYVGPSKKYNITEGPFLGSGGGTTSFIPKVYLNYMDLSSTLIGAVPGVSGSGILATIKFKVLRSGNCTLRLDPTRTTLYNSTSIIPLDRTLQDGNFYTNRPVARFSYTPNTAYGSEFYGRPIVGETVTFNGTVSYDPDEPYDSTPGGIVSYEWDFGDDNTGTGSIATHVYDEPGFYTVTLNVTDDEGEKDSIGTPVIGDPAIKVQRHDIAALNVTVTPVTFIPGATVSINVTVLNKSTVDEYLNITMYQNFNPVKTVQFGYYRRTDVGWQWRNDLPLEENATATIEWDTTGIYPGNYTLGVYVFLINRETKGLVPGLEKEEVLPDNWMSYGTITATGEERHDLAITDIKVSPTDLKINQFSNMEATLKNNGNVNEQFNATLTVTYDSELFSQKTWLNQTISAGATMKLELNLWLSGANTTKEGTYNAIVNVILINATTLDFLEPYNASIPDDVPDDNRRSEPANIRIFPVAHFTYSPSELLVDTPVTFDASYSYAPGVPSGTIDEYAWDFGDGATRTGKVTTHIYRFNGTFTVTLKVTDDSALSHSITKSLTVGPFGNIAITNLAFSPLVATRGQLVSINVTVSTRLFQEDFNVSVFFDDTEIDTQSDIALPVGSSTTLTFAWETAGVAEGNHVIKAVAVTLTEETTFVGGIVSINRLRSTLTLGAFPASFTIGATATINGTLFPTQADSTVTIQYRLGSEGTWSTLETVTTSSDGVYSHSWVPDKAGTYAIKSSWLGDDARMPGESEVVVVTVNEVSQPSLFLYTTIALAVVIVVLVFYFFVKIRKPKP